MALFEKKFTVENGSSKQLAEILCIIFKLQCTHHLINPFDTFMIATKPPAILLNCYGKCEKTINLIDAILAYYKPQDYTYLHGNVWGIIDVEMKDFEKFFPSSRERINAKIYLQDMLVKNGVNKEIVDQFFVHEH